jgi:hypothetical protein
LASREGPIEQKQEIIKKLPWRNQAGAAGDYKKKISLPKMTNEHKILLVTQSQYYQSSPIFQATMHLSLH